jgi:hypothetical protein
VRTKKETIRAIIRNNRSEFATHQIFKLVEGLEESLEAKTVTPEHVVGALLLEVQRRYPGGTVSIVWDRRVEAKLFGAHGEPLGDVTAPSLAAALQKLLSND